MAKGRKKRRTCGFGVLGGGAWLQNNSLLMLISI